MQDDDNNEILDWSSKKILIVEDDIYSAEYLIEVLADTKIHVEVTRNGLGAIEKVKEEKFDLILMDIQLPGLSGEKATELIRKFDKDTPIIAQTAHAMSDDKEKYLNAGCNDYLAKPILINDFLTTIKKYL